MNESLLNFQLINNNNFPKCLICGYNTDNLELNNKSVCFYCENNSDKQFCINCNVEIITYYDEFDSNQLCSYWACKYRWKIVEEKEIIDIDKYSSVFSYYYNLEKINLTDFLNNEYVKNEIDKIKKILIYIKLHKDINNQIIAFMF